MLDAFTTSSGKNLETVTVQKTKQKTNLSSIPEYQRNYTFHMDRTKTVGTVQYFTLKYKGKIRLYIGCSKCKCIYA